jgi:hypothetical protein
MTNDRSHGWPHRGSLRTHQRIVIAHHLILHGYGHWAPNDPRGSGSAQVRKSELRDMAPLHRGRRRVQPSREALCGFKRALEPRLEFPFCGSKPRRGERSVKRLARLLPSENIRYGLALFCKIMFIFACDAIEKPAGSFGTHSRMPRETYCDQMAACRPNIRYGRNGRMQCFCIRRLMFIA